MLQPTRDAPERSPEETPSPHGRRRAFAAIGLVALAIVALLAALAWFGIQQLTSWLPFAETQTVNRTQGAVLLALDDLAEFHASTGRFQVIVDIERDVSGVPTQIAGERVLFVAQGSVDATVDFSQLDTASVHVDEPGQSVVIELPRAELSDAVVDPDASYVFDRQRGLLDRLGGIFTDSPTSERQLYLAAEEELARAAAESELVEQGQRNTTAMLQSLLGSLGFADITVTYS